ncbi:MAG: DEAD/DEAH box helicase [Opitutales bacterium]|jgi:SNF2 family DNA or RNA helicase|nr:DEAD/DEAH box helicase [Opitutales bacterium]MDP4643647.1 DEAD/DEAH box helicase [Opitutales bacterium]MDP4776803.1 DEAD/DEAH box helicase [Opitutales bacterium]MDP4884580.1 DEAD/DEAH box helicase [Opitutales bacterium]MDP5079570.1 DEAD/DEAH box helicase [Opitutales bacterium]
MSKPAPKFDRSFLIELGGGLVFKQAERLFETAAVKSVVWESPVLIGKVKGMDATYEPKLNLRSTVFAVNNCNCEDGQKRKVCAHAIAAALHFQALKEEAKHVVVAEAVVAEAEPETAAPVAPKLRSLKTSEDGMNLRMLVFLPPNFEAAVERDAIVVKVDAAAGREILPLGNVNTAKAYKISPAQEKALILVEAWCGGKLASLLQLTAGRLRRLLDLLVDEPVVYWVKKPNAPIDWVDGKLPEVYSLLPEATVEAEEKDAPVAVEEPKRLSFKQGISLREKPRPNLRAIAEAKRPKLFQTRAGDYPTASAVSDSMESYDAKSIVVDGSLNFIAIRLPSSDVDSVKPLRDILKTSGFMLEPSNRKWWLRDRHKTLNFLASHWRDLKDQWQAVFTKNFEDKLAHVELSALNIETKEEAGKFSLEVSLSKEGDETDLRRAIASGKSYIDTEEGTITLLDTASVNKLHEIERAISGQADRPFTPTFSKRLETQELVDVEDLLDEMTEGWQPPQAWQSRSMALKQVGALEAAPVRPGFDAILRTYQRIGVAWLWHLYRNELGGILADEMGLGKTLQALALIECIRTENTDSMPALVVCPASLVENWMREAARFTPGLKLAKHHGTKRAKEPADLEQVDIVITSYGTLRQDSDMLSTMDWCVVIGDEAQHIKNRRTQNAKSLTRLHSKGRFLLTGTPVENSLDDLLSLFAFLMPGYLQTAHGKLSQEDKAWHSKRQTARAAAYILRRTKKEVAPELPDKIEKTFFCELGNKQHRFYQNTLEKTRREIFNLEMAGANAGRVQFAAFTELLRLRQACVDPRIIDETFPEKESAKLAAFDEVLDECIDTGSRILVFSSFVTALKLLAQHLEAKGHKFSYLDGKTRNRLAVCDQFNEDESIPVFLISLKAGGTGLNLTGADTVVHYDPWWNPAAEAQATDRAHRIGQKKVVTSIKLIAANTVEEKVLELQAKKAEILKELFEESEAANAKVSLDDIKSLLD